MSQDLTIYCPNGAPVSMFVSLSNGERDILVESDIPSNWSVRHDLRELYEDKKLNIFDETSTMALVGPHQWIAFLHVYAVLKGTNQDDARIKFIKVKETSIKRYAKSIGKMWEASVPLFLEDNSNLIMEYKSVHRVDRFLKGESFPKYKMLAIKALEDRKKFIMDFDKEHGTNFSVMIPEDA